MTPYADAADQYLQCGWNPLPLPAGEKAPPPAGFTGWDGEEPTADQVAEWVELHSGGNVGLRMPLHVIGVDVDAYEGKGGLSTFSDWVAAHGGLPATFRSSSRAGDPVSGIRFYRLPAEADLHNLRSPGEGIDLVHFGHRYAVVPPSLHPSGESYAWHGPNGGVEIPRTADLPYIPVEHLAHLTRVCDCFRQMGDSNLPASSPTGPRFDGPAGAYAEAVGAIQAGSSRHDTTNAAVLAIVWHREAGHTDAATLLAKLEGEFISGVTNGSGQVRTPGQAQTEWDRMIAGAERKIAANEELKGLIEGSPKQEPTPVVPLGDVLRDVIGFLRRFMHFERPEQAVAIALWIVATYVFDTYEVTPYLHIRSPEKRSGKTLLLDLLGLWCRTPLPVANMSPAAMYRVVEQRRPTLLLDEVDAVFPRGRKGDPAKEELRGLLNAGYRKGAAVFRSNQNGDLIEFSPFCPKALAGIGNLPDTIADRCIPIALQRKPRSVSVSRFRLRKVAPEGHLLAEEIAAATGSLSETLAIANPLLPDDLNDREQDTWELLLAIADHAGGDWPEAARSAAVKLSEDALDATETEGIKLLSDLRSVWRSHEIAIPTRDLLERLQRIDESPWGDWYGKPINARFLSQKLKPYGITSTQVKVGGKNLKGYRRDHVARAWTRYVETTDATTGDTSDTSATPHTPQGESQGYPEATDQLRDDSGGGSSRQVAERYPAENPGRAKAVAQVAEVADIRGQEVLELVTVDDWRGVVESIYRQGGDVTFKVRGRVPVSVASGALEGDSMSEGDTVHIVKDGDRLKVTITERATP